MAAKKKAAVVQLPPGKAVKASSRTKTGKATSRPRVGTEVALGETAEFKSADKKKPTPTPKPGDLVEVHSPVLGVHGLHTVLDPDDQDGILVQSPGSHLTMRVVLADIEAVFRRL